MTAAYDPLAQRAYLLLQLADAANECEIIACEVALRALERHNTHTRHISWLEQSQTGEQDG